MSDFIKGLSQNKLRTALNFFTALAVSVTICVTAASAMGNAKGGTPPIIADEGQAVTSTAENKNDNQSGMPQDGFGKQRSENNSGLYIIIGTLAAGAVLLIIINTVGSDKKSNRTALLIESGKTPKALKLRFFSEAVVIVIIAGIIGTGLGAAVASPVSSALRQGSTPSLSDEMPSGQAPTINNDDKSNTDNNRFSSDNQQQFQNGKERSGFNSIDYMTGCGASLLSTALLAVIGGLSAACSVKKTIYDDEDSDEEEDDE